MVRQHVRFERGRLCGHGLVGMGSMLVTLTACCEKPPVQNAGGAAAPTAFPTNPSTDTTLPPAVGVGVGVGACRAKATKVTRRLTRTRNRIVGGGPAGEGTYPFAVALATDAVEAVSQYCGGSLIADRWVLTAAHCEVRLGEFAIVGRYDLNGNQGEAIPVKRVLNHADYDPGTNDNDLALVELQNPTQAPVLALHQTAPDFVGDSTVIGWGRLESQGARPAVLHHVSVPVVTNQVCASGYAPQHISITGNMLCAGLAQGGKDSCQGDSGGPLLVQGANGEWQQAGVVSFGVGCAEPNLYGVYTRVSQYAGWIQACTSSSTSSSTSQSP